MTGRLESPLATGWAQARADRPPDERIWTVRTNEERLLCYAVSIARCDDTVNLHFGATGQGGTQLDLLPLRHVTQQMRAEVKLSGTGWIVANRSG
jgi:hypothetical protein